MTGEYVILTQPTPFIAAEARDLRWKHEINLRGMDYMHVASAVEMKCTEFLTTDRKITGQAEKIGALNVVVRRPADTALLPDEYRQEDWLDDKVTPLNRAGT